MADASTPATPVIERTILAPADLVFDAWIKPELVHKWLFADPDNDTKEVQIDPQAGGNFRIVERDLQHNTPVTYEGVYTQINRPTELAFSLTAPGITEAIVFEVHFEALGKETRISVTEKGSAPGGGQIDWKRMLQQLALTLENQ